MTKKKPVTATLELTKVSATYLDMVASGQLESVSPETTKTYARDIAEKDALGEDVDINKALHASLYAIANLQQQIDALNFILADAAGFIKDTAEELAKGGEDERHPDLR